MILILLGDGDWSGVLEYNVDEGVLFMVAYDGSGGEFCVVVPVDGGGVVCISIVLNCWGGCIVV